MNKPSSYWSLTASLAAAGLTLLASASPIQAATALNGSLTQRPLTPTEIKTYGLTGTNAQFSAGISTVGLGEPVYVDAMVNAAIAPSNINNVVWTLASKPAGSKAVLSAGPLGANVPIYKAADRMNQAGSAVYQLAGRVFFRADAVGSYTLNATVAATGSGSTNLTLSFVGATYLGVQNCLGCHSGHFSEIPNKSSFTNTPHASFFARAIDGQESDHYSKNCISCHVVGYDTNSFAINGGFDDMATLLGWQFPTVLTNNPSNWAAMPSQLQNLANIQCENCHGPGSQHVYGGGDTNMISVTYVASDCSQCHDSLNTHFKSAEWNNSLHAVATRTPSGTSRPQCVRCHTAAGFTGWAKAGGMTMLNANPTSIFWADSSSTNIMSYSGVAPTYVTPTNNPPNTVYEALTCQTCHDPHDASNPHQLRFNASVTLSDGTTITNAGAGGFCMECHNSRNGSVTSMMAKYPLNQANWAGGVAFGTHDSPQGDMLEGVNAITYGRVIPSSPHANVVTDTCAGCHMQAVASTDPAFLKAGGHTFKMAYVTNGVEVPLTTVCAQCHGKLKDFDFPVADYNGDGIIEGVQTEVHHLLDKLSTLYPPSGYQANPNNYVADGKVKSSLSTYTNMPAKFLNAAYNFQFVAMDASFGVHNAAYAVGLLKASIGDLTGDNNMDGLPDSWQITYFGAGFATNAAAGPNAINNTAGVPNWMMSALNLNPTGTFTVDGSGAILINDGNVLNGDTNNIAIYTAAEVVFDTVPGTTYQIQGITEMTGSWQNIGTNIVGTGSSVSYMTPTRGVQQMFYRVVHNP